LRDNPSKKSLTFQQNRTDRHSSCCAFCLVWAPFSTNCAELIGIYQQPGRGVVVRAHWRFDREDQLQFLKGKFMIRSTWKFCILSAALTVLSAAPTLAQQVKGDSEIGLSGALTFVPITSAGVTTIATDGTVTLSYGLYFTRGDLFGIDDQVEITGVSGGGQSLTIDDTFDFRYRHLFGGKASKVYPFVGGGGGFRSSAAPGMSNGTGASTTTTDGQYDIEAGVKFYVSEKTAFEVAYQYQSYQEGTGSSSTWQQVDVINFGFTYVFGGPKSKH
jgi:hypothetical protein